MRTDSFHHTTTWGNESECISLGSYELSLDLLTNHTDIHWQPNCSTLLHVVNPTSSTRSLQVHFYWTRTLLYAFAAIKSGNHIRILSLVMVVNHPPAPMLEVRKVMVCFYWGTPEFWFTWIALLNDVPTDRVKHRPWLAYITSFTFLSGVRMCDRPLKTHNFFFQISINIKT